MYCITFKNGKSYIKSFASHLSAEYWGYCWAIKCNTNFVAATKLKVGSYFKLAQ